MAVVAFNGQGQGWLRYDIVSNDGKAASGFLQPRQASPPLEGQPPFRAKFAASGIWEKFDIPDDKIIVLGMNLVDA